MKTRFMLVTAALLGLLVAACTRSATTATVPTEGAAGQSAETQAVGTPASGGDPTMEALGTQLAATQEAQQAGGGAETSAAPANTPEAPAAATDTPTAVVPPATATPIAPTETPVPPTPTAVAGCASPYTVKAGDWLYKIARDCKLDPAALLAANPGLNANRLTPGQKLNLPGAAPAAAATSAPAAAATTAPAAQACKGTYTVKAGDNLFRIAYNCGLTTEQMARANNIPAPYIIKAGDVLKYP